MRRSVFRDMLDQLSERFADRQKFSEILGGEIRTGFGSGRRFTADLNYADHFSVGENWSTDYFLNRRGSQGIGLHALKNAGMTNRREIIHNVRPAFANGARRQGRRAGQRYVAYIAERLGNEKIEMTPALGDRENGDFVRFDIKILGNSIGERGNRELIICRVPGSQAVGESFQFGSEAFAHGLVASAIRVDSQAQTCMGAGSEIQDNREPSRVMRKMFCRFR